MKIAIRGHASRGKEVIQILENLGGENRYDQSGSNEEFVYFINNIGFIYSVTLQMCSNERRIYTLEEFEKEFPFKIGDKVTDHEGDVAIITGFAYIEEKLGYSLQYENGRGTATSGILKPYKEMKKTKNITLTLDKAKEWYKKGGELKEIALQAFSEKELNSFPKSWEEYCRKHKSICLSTRYADNILLKYDALLKLEQLRNCWWNGWEPDWNDEKQTKYCIVYYKGEFKISILCETRHFLSFPTKEMAEEFLKCFRDLIEQAGDLI